MIPIYKAKKIDSDEWVEGFYKNGSYKDIIGIHNEHFIVVSYTPSDNECWGGSELLSKIDPNTLAIHFPNMIDKNGKKIFASLSEDGIGGDIIRIDEYGKAKLKIEDGSILCEWVEDDATSEALSDILYKNRVRPNNFIEIIGIHKG